MAHDGKSDRKTQVRHVLVCLAVVACGILCVIAISDCGLRLVIGAFDHSGDLSSDSQWHWWANRLVIIIMLYRQLAQT